MTGRKAAFLSCCAVMLAACRSAGVDGQAFLSVAKVNELYQHRETPDGSFVMVDVAVEGTVERITDYVLLTDPDTGASLSFFGERPKLPSGRSQHLKIIADIEFLDCTEFVRCGLSITRYRTVQARSH